MRKLLIILFSFFVGFMPLVYGQVRSIMGGAVSQPPTVFSLCPPGTGCPRSTAPSYTDPNRVWGGDSSCRTSINGGRTFQNCTTQPFSSGQRESYAEASSGALVGVARVGNDCLIRRSTDQGASWATVFTAVNLPCGGAVIGGSYIKCIPGGTCVTAYSSVIGQVCEVYRSIDNGLTWFRDITGSLTCSAPVSLSVSATGGVSNADTMSANSGAHASGSPSSWVINPAYSFSSCWGTLVLSSDPFTVCYNSTLHEYQYVNTFTGIVGASAVLPGSIQLAASGGVSYSPTPGTIYTLASYNQGVTGPLPIGVYMSNNNGASFFLIGTTLPTNSMREGDMWEHPFNQCVYFSSGSSPMLGAIC